MFRNTKTLEGFELSARDGTIGHVKDFYFDDHQWQVRYLVVDAGQWLASRQVLISPHAVRGTGWERKLLTVDLTKEQVRNSPGIDTAQPVSREHQRALNDYYRWPHYWSDAGVGLGVGFPLDPIATVVPPFPDAPSHGESSGRATAERETGTVDDPELRSVREVTGYHIEATDGPIGHVADFIIEEATWSIRYLVVDTRNWWPGRHVLLSPHWISAVDWATSTVAVDLARQSIESSPPYDPETSLSENYVESLHTYYGRSPFDI